MATQAQVTQAIRDELVKGFDWDEDLSKKDVENFLDAQSAVVARFVKKEKNSGIPVRGLGRFRLADRKARMGRNPQTGEAIKIKASKKLKMTVEKKMRDAVGSK